MKKGLRPQRAPVDWIANQSGHTKGKMISQQYGMWINDDGTDVVDMLQIASSSQAVKEW